MTLIESDFGQLLVVYLFFMLFSGNGAEADPPKAVVLQGAWIEPG
jgi:hypothetical protein